MTRAQYTQPVYRAGVVKNLDTGETGLPGPNSHWYGYLSRDNAYTLGKLQVLDPQRHAPAVMAQREKLKERRIITIKSVEIIEGKPRLKVTKQEVLNNEFVLGRKLTTPSYAMARNKQVGKKEALEPKTLSAFGAMLEHFAKKDGTVVDDDEYIKDYRAKTRNNTNIAFSWTEEDKRELNPLTSQVEIGSMSVVSPKPEGIETIQFSLFEDETGRHLHRQVWLSDPAYVAPDIPGYPASNSGEERTEYDKLLAGIIETTYQMESAAQQGYASVDNIEAIEAIGFASRNIDS